MEYQFTACKNLSTLGKSHYSSEYTNEIHKKVILEKLFCLKSTSFMAASELRIGNKTALVHKSKCHDTIFNIQMLVISHFIHFFHLYSGRKGEWSYINPDDSNGDA